MVDSDSSLHTWCNSCLGFHDGHVQYCAINQEYCTKQPGLEATSALESARDSVVRCFTTRAANRSWVLKFSSEQTTMDARSNLANSVQEHEVSYH